MTSIIKSISFKTLSVVDTSSKNNNTRYVRESYTFHNKFISDFNNYNILVTK